MSQVVIVLRVWIPQRRRFTNPSIPPWLYEKMLSPSETYYRGQVRGKLTSTSLPPVSPSNDGMKPEGDDGIQQM
jgi:hypothetical protein